MSEHNLTSAEIDANRAARHVAAIPPNLSASEAYTAVKASLTAAGYTEAAGTRVKITLPAFSNPATNQNVPVRDVFVDYFTAVRMILEGKATLATL